MKGVQSYAVIGGLALKNHAFSSIKVADRARVTVHTRADMPMNSRLSRKMPLDGDGTINQSRVSKISSDFLESASQSEEVDLI